MVFATSESSEFINSRTESEDGNDCLLDERELSETKRNVTNPSVLSRILISFGFMKGIVEDSCSRGEITNKIEHGKYDSLKPCDQLYDSTLKESLITKEESCNESMEKDIDYGTFLEFSDLEPLENMALQIKEIVTKSPDCTGIRVTDSIALRIARDIIEAAENEPCGLQGCKVMLTLEDRIGTIDLGNFKPKDGFLCTFEVNVVLNLRTNMIKYFIPFLACMPQTKHISDHYCLRKEKLYTCNSSRGSTPVQWQ